MISSVSEQIEEYGTRTCIQCGWVHFGVSREYAEREVKEFNEYYDKQPTEVKELFGSHSNIKNYERCGCCGGSYKNFRVSKENDCPEGCTLNPIICNLNVESNGETQT